MRQQLPSDARHRLQVQRWRAPDGTPQPRHDQQSTVRALADIDWGTFKRAVRLALYFQEQRALGIVDSVTVALGIVSGDAPPQPGGEAHAVNRPV